MKNYKRIKNSNNLIFIFTIIILTGIYSCNQSKTNDTSDFERNSKTTLGLDLESTDYEFDFDLKLPPEYYFDTLTIYDSVSQAHYTSYCLQSSLPEMNKFNEAIIKTLKKRVKYEQLYVGPYPGNDNTDPVFTYELGLFEFFANNQIISLCHIVDCYTEGANHHNYSWFTFNYNIELNKIISFKDVFDLSGKDDSISFLAFTKRNKIKDACMDWELPFDSVDFSFNDKGIYINPELSWACSMNRSLLPANSLEKFTTKNWMKKIVKLYIDTPTEPFRILTDTMEYMGWIADTNRLKKVDIYNNLKNSKTQKFNNKIFYKIDLAEHLIFTWENSGNHTADSLNYRLFEKAKSIWAYFYRNKSDKITIRDGVIEQWEFDNENTAKSALQNLKQVYPLPYFNTQPYYLQVENYLFIFNTRASAFSYSQEEIYEIFKNITAKLFALVN